MADVGYISAARAARPSRAGSSQPAARPRAASRRFSSRTCGSTWSGTAPRGSTRGPDGGDIAGPAAAGGREGGRRRPAPARQAPRFPECRSGLSPTGSRSRLQARPMGAAVSVGDIVPAVVLGHRHPGGAAGRAAGAIRFASVVLRRVPKAGYAWTRKTSPAFVKVGDLVAVRCSAGRSHAVGDGRVRAGPGRRRRAPRHRQPDRTDSGDGRRLRLRPQQVQPRAAGQRQMGSTFKPIVYTAAIDRASPPGRSSTTRLSRYPAGPGQPLYSPQNYDRTFKGPITLRRALEQSRNVPTVKLLESSARRSSTTPGASASPTRCSRICRSRSAPPKPRRSRRRAPTRCSRARASA